MTRSLKKLCFVRRSVFTALHALRAMRSLVTRKLSVRLSVLLASDTRVICDKTKETCHTILIPYEASFTVFF